MQIIKLIKNPVLLLFITIILQSFSLLSIKYSTLESGYFSLALLVMAFGFIGLRAVFWQYALKLSDLSHMYPFASLVQVLVFLYAVVLFKEAITLNNVIGLGVMMSGVYFMSRKSA